VDLLPSVIEAVRAARGAISLVAAEDPRARKLARQLLKCADAGWVVADL
jgi:hypothetical protein